MKYSDKLVNLKRSQKQILKRKTDLFIWFRYKQLGNNTFYPRIRKKCSENWIASQYSKCQWLISYR